VNFDGNAKDIAEKISEIINYPVQESIGYPTPGSFGTFAGIERNIPTITLELSDKESIETLYKSCREIFMYLATA
jgi:protein MpaA